MCLTFDDGPNTTTTVHVLDVLKKYNVPASFFLIGRNITDQSMRMIDRELEQGCTIECHSWTHPAFPDLSAQQMIDEVESTNSAIEKICGIKPVFFRPPYIALNDLMYETIHMPFIQGRGVEDWVFEIPAQKKAQDVLDKAHDGEIILLHDSEGNETTAQALEIFIPALLEKGAEFYNVREMFKACNVDPNRPHTIWTDLL